MPPCAGILCSGAGRLSRSGLTWARISANSSSSSLRSSTNRTARSEASPRKRRPAMNRCPKIGYVLKRFPRLSETFILNEILELERLGTPVQIYSLVDVTLEEAGGPRHRLLQELKSPVIYLPARQPLKKWRVKVGQFSGGDFTPRLLKEICGGEVPPESMLLLQSALIGSLARVQGVEHLHAHFGTDATAAAMLASRVTGIPFSFTAHAKDIFHQTV